MKNNELEESLKESKIQLEKELADAKLLQSISTELIFEEDIQMLFEKIIDASMQIMNSQYASMQMLYNEHDNVKLDLLAYRGFNEEAIRFWSSISIEESVSTCSKALRTGRRVIVPNINECDFMQGKEDLRIYLQTGINAAQSTPLYSRSGNILGMISTHWDKPYEPSERELRLFDVLARQVADLIEQKQAKEKIKWDKEKAEILYEVTEKLLESVHPEEIVEELCVKVMKFLKCDVFFNYLIDDEKMKLHLNSCAGVSEEEIDKISMLNYNDAVCGCVSQDANKMILDKIQSKCRVRTNIIKSFEINAYACYPLMEKNKVIGTLSFGTKSKDNFNEDEIELMKAVSNHVAIAMNRIRTKEELKRQQQLIIKAEGEKIEALEKTMEMKDEFLSIISHELRTPINVISTATQALNFIYTDEMSDKVKSYIKTIQQNNLRQLRLVNNLLDITRFNSGHIKVNKRNMDIVFITKAITESVYQYACQKGVEITFVSSLAKKIVGIDDEKYERIILNILSNAIKFTPKGKDIKVKLRSIKDNIIIEIKDSGIGIPPNKIDLIFERFGQVDSSLSRQAEGTGIGLSLVKNFVEALGGSISVKSKVGRGSTFTVVLPSKKVVEEKQSKKMVDLLNNRLVHVTHVEFSDIYL